ncbi:MAG TPA: XRE family transcriptional regulator [Cyanobacteria bacterium UBA8553]|nr:XRE family transcriptional regulator [Cyanobacteria bacterium UBA8553]HAJ60579.1 XRE family transcriptional regulator [Cyanobacteria bacterium UBA8543]
MGQAGKALKKVLETYDISQYRLAAELGIGRSNVYRWVNEVRDPTAETVKDIVDVLRKINSAAAQEFILLYLGGGSAEDEVH